MPSASSFLIRGVWCAMLTPMARDGTLDHARFASHAQWLLAHGVAGLAPFGTTGEGQSFAADERRAGLEALIAGGVAAQRILPGTGGASLPETVALTRHAVEAGCIGCLVLPPFFWKEPSDDGLFAWYAQLIERVADPRLRLFLYHLPQISHVPLSVDLVARLAAAFPDVIAGVKDSAGVWAHTAALCARLPQLAIVIGHEPHLPQLMRAGGAGTICGVANVLPALVARLVAPAATEADVARVRAFIEILFRQPFLPAFKAMIAQRQRDPAWCHVRAPLLPLPGATQAALAAALADAGFDLARGE
ncbi:MAG: dihydrodipicolinate synthase family protein [Burkholderiales bacterium]